MTRKLSARRRLLPGDACKYIKHAELEIKAGDRVVLVCRVSTRDQRSHLRHQERLLRQWAMARGAIVVDVIYRDEPGLCKHDEDFEHLLWLRDVALRAIALDAVALAESTDRWIRHPGYGNKWPDAQARDTDLAEVRDYTLGVVLATLVAPNARPGETRAHQIKRGQAATGAPGGRPTKRPGYKKRWREELTPQVKRMVAEGASINRIAAELKIPRRTARRWERSFLADAE